jgi:GT2 family glycosyltransferase
MDVDSQLDEIIIVDNASTDLSISYVNDNYPKVNVVVLERNYGFAGAVNKGIAAAKGRFVVLLNNDTEVCKGWHTSLIETIESDPRIFSVSSKMIQMNNKDFIDDAGDGYTVLGWAFKRGDRHRIVHYNEPEEVFSSCAGAAIYRKDIFEQIGVFDEEFFAYLEDIDLSYRAKVHGYVNYYSPAAKVYHVGSATSGESKGNLNSFKVHISARNNVYLIYKNMPFLQILINSPLLFMGFLWKWRVYGRLGFGKDFLKGTLQGWSGLGRINRVRHKFKYVPNYLRIEKELILNTFSYYNSRKERDK